MSLNKKSVIADTGLSRKKRQLNFILEFIETPSCSMKRGQKKWIGIFQLMEGRRYRRDYILSPFLHTLIIPINTQQIQNLCICADGFAMRHTDEEKQQL